MFLIVGIQPNIDPLKTLYFVRDSDPEEAYDSIDPNDEENTETSLTGQKLFDILFSNFEYGDLLINSEVYLQFIVAYIKYYSKIWNFQNLLAPIIYFRNPNLFSDYNEASCTMNLQKTILVRLFFYFYIKKHKFICIIHRIVSLNLEFLS